ncbi:MAG: putative heme transporter [Pseudonocardiales bacterium]|nr:putative heme transporter [Pseudonocardiales bacterium]
MAQVDLVTGTSRTGGSRRRRWLLVALALAAAALAGEVLYNSSDEVLAAADTLTHLQWWWVAVALVAEAISYLLRGGAQYVVLRRGIAYREASLVDRPASAASTPGPVALGAGMLAGDAAAYCLPLGFAASGVVVFGLLRRRGVDPTVAAWMYAVSTVQYVGAVALLTIVAVQVAGDADPVPGLQSLSIGLLAALLLVGLGYALAHRKRTAALVARPLAGLIRSARALTAPVRASAGRRRAARAEAGRPSSAPTRVAAWLRHRVDELRTIRLPARSGAIAFGLMLVSWACDIAVLGIAYAAVGAVPPWAGLLLAYCAGQIAGALPVTPGGIGVVEGSLTLALVAFGGAASITLAAVLLYRLIAYWACIPLGGVAWLVLRALVPPDRAVPPAAAPVMQGDPR